MGPLRAGGHIRWDAAVHIDERFHALVEHFADEPDVDPPDDTAGHRFGAGALRVGGAIFAMVVTETLVLKLPRRRVDALVAAGVCAPFSGGRAQPMREWAAVVDDDVSGDTALAREALEFVRAGRR